MTILRKEYRQKRIKSKGRLKELKEKKSEHKNIQKRKPENVMQLSRGKKVVGDNKRKKGYNKRNNRKKITETLKKC